jgi:hypothetical protein
LSIRFGKNLGRNKTPVNADQADFQGLFLK